jgi:hypothetical protein
VRHAPAPLEARDPRAELTPVIISDDHRYVFIQQPHTACTSIAAELREHYGGRPLLAKHATYGDFLRVATPEQKRYFVFSGIRNPLDEAVSLYFKFRTDHDQKYTLAASQAKGNPVVQAAFLIAREGPEDFGRYLRRRFSRPFDNGTLIYHKRMDRIIRFEHLQEDFAATLAALGLEQVRPLPHVNPTDKRGNYLDFYPEELRPHAVRIFGPFMRKWGYPLPPTWGQSIPTSAMLEFQVLGVVRYIVRRYLRRPSGRTSTIAGRFVMPLWRSAATRRLRSRRGVDR